MLLTSEITGLGIHCAQELEIAFVARFKPLFRCSITLGEIPTVWQLENARKRLHLQPDGSQVLCHALIFARGDDLRLRRPCIPASTQEGKSLASISSSPLLVIRSYAFLEINDFTCKISMWLLAECISPSYSTTEVIHNSSWC
jgi:hypothetical protein